MWASARQEECEAIGGAWEVASTSRKVSSETWETSTIMPRRFISRTTWRPKSVRPPCRFTLESVMSPEESAQLLVFTWVSVM